MKGLRASQDTFEQGPVTSMLETIPEQSKVELEHSPSENDGNDSFMMNEEVSKCNYDPIKPYVKTESRMEERIIPEAIIENDE